MSEKKRIEDSLQICRELEEFYIEEDLAAGPEPENSAKLDEDTEAEIDKILQEKEEAEPKPESDEPESEPKLKLEPKIKPEPGRENTIQLESLYDAIPDTEIGMGSNEDSDDTQEEYNEKHPFLRTVLSLSVCIVIALLVSLCITKYIAHHTSVEGNSMEPTFYNSDQLIVENISYYLHEPERFDVIVFPFTDEISYIKRIIGLPGEKIRILNGNIYINDKLLKEDYGKEKIREPGIAVNGITLGEDEYFVLGDNRNASVDSRKEEVGPIHRSDIKGKVWLRVYPFDKFGLLE